MKIFPTHVYISQATTNQWWQIYVY